MIRSTHPVGTEVRPHSRTGALSRRRALTLAAGGAVTALAVHALAAGRRPVRGGGDAPAGLDITEFELPTPDSRPGGIVVGPDGALWFGQSGGNSIGRAQLRVR